MPGSAEQGSVHQTLPPQRVSHPTARALACGGIPRHKGRPGTGKGTGARMRTGKANGQNSVKSTQSEGPSRPEAHEARGGAGSSLAGRARGRARGSSSPRSRFGNHVPSFHLECTGRSQQGRGPWSNPFAKPGVLIYPACGLSRRDVLWHKPNEVSRAIARSYGNRTGF